MGQLKGAILRLYIITGKSMYITWKTAATKSLLPMPFINFSPTFNTDVPLTIYVNHTSYFWPFIRSLLKNFKQICSMASPTHLFLQLSIINITINQSCSLKHIQPRSRKESILSFIFTQFSKYTVKFRVPSKIYES